MINLKLLKACSSLRETTSLQGKFRFFTDTRLYSSPGVFVAIPGSKVNPLDKLESVLSQGCPLVIYTDSTINRVKTTQLHKSFPQTVFLPVSDSITFLQELTREHVKQWKSLNNNKKVLGISGSNGKTTHKEMLAFLLNNLLPGKVVATEKNNNNHLGVPLTLLNVTDETEIVVLELGSNHPGEIKFLCDIAKPNCGLTTNIGATHLEFFGSEESVFEEESYLYESVKENTSGKGLFLINLDDHYLQKLIHTPGSITFGETEDAAARVSFLRNGAKIHFEGKDYPAINEYITGKHNQLNLVVCLFIASRLFPELKDSLVIECQKFRPTKNRSEWITFNNSSIYLDAYNANPSSMKIALEGFKESVLARGYQLDQSFIVLGDMNELGKDTGQYHKQLGEFVQNLGFKNVCFIGQFSKYYLEGYPTGHSEESTEAFITEYRSQYLGKFPIHFIKGSRTLQLESLFDIN